MKVSERELLKSQADTICLLEHDGYVVCEHVRRRGRVTERREREGDE